MTAPTMTRAIFKRTAAALASTLLWGLCTGAAQAGELTIYTSTEGDNLKVFSERFSKAHPDIKVNWVRDSTGIIQARLMAEKDAPRNDLIFAHAATDLLALDAMNLFLPYTPKGLDKLDARYRDKKAAPTWTGLWGFANAICFNTVEAAKRNIPRPVQWADLAKPVYKGQITMPNPASSGTGYLSVAGWLQIMGKDKAWSIHGRPARQHRRLLAFRLQALQPGGRPANTWWASRCPAALQTSRPRARPSRP
jgi:iron(III) transport system substrate-binding protein